MKEHEFSQLGECVNCYCFDDVPLTHCPGVSTNTEMDQRILDGRLDYRETIGWHDPRGYDPELARRVAVAESLQRRDHTAAFYDWHHPQ